MLTKISSAVKTKILVCFKQFDKRKIGGGVNGGRERMSDRSPFIKERRKFKNIYLSDSVGFEDNKNNNIDSIKAWIDLIVCH